MDEVELNFEPEALAVIAERALLKKTGARALRAILEEFMLDIMYEIPKDETIGRVTITRDYVEKKGAPGISDHLTSPPTKMVTAIRQINSNFIILVKRFFFFFMLGGL